MSDIDEETHHKMRRSIGAEIYRAETDFDTTRDIRAGIVDKLRFAAENVTLIDKDTKKVNDDTEVELKVIQMTLRALEDVEKAGSKLISIKQKQQEADAMSAAATKERLEIVIRATAPGRIEDNAMDGDLEAHLAEMFTGDIQAFELKSSPRDLSD